MDSFWGFTLLPNHSSGALWQGHLLSLSVIQNKQAALVTLLSGNRGRPSCPTYIHSHFMWGVHYGECCYRQRMRSLRLFAKQHFKIERQKEWFLFLRGSLLTQALIYLSGVVPPHTAGKTSNKYSASSRGNCFTQAASLKKTIKAHQSWRLHRCPESCAADTRI